MDTIQRGGGGRLENFLINSWNQPSQPPTPEKWAQKLVSVHHTKQWFGVMNISRLLLFFAIMLNVMAVEDPC